MNIIARILDNYIHYESDWSVENYEWLDPLLAVCAAPLAYVIRRGRASAARPLAYEGGSEARQYKY